MLTVSGGALRRYLDARGELPDSSLLATVPVSVHETTSRSGGSNKVSALFTKLGTDVADPLERLRGMTESNRHAKEHHKAIDADTLQDWAEFAAPRTFGLAVRLYSGLRLAEKHPVVHNLVISNVPGPPVPLYFMGAKIEALYPLGPVFHGAGLNITVMSNNGQVHVGLIACRELMPKVWELAEDFPAELEALRAAAQKQEAGGASSPGLTGADESVRAELAAASRRHFPCCSKTVGAFWWSRVMTISERTRWAPRPRWWRLSGRAWPALHDVLWAARTPEELVEVNVELERLRSAVAAVQLRVGVEVDAVDAAKSVGGWQSSGDYLTAAAAARRGHGQRLLRTGKALCGEQFTTMAALAGDEGLVEPVESVTPQLAEVPASLAEAAARRRGRRDLVPGLRGERCREAGERRRRPAP